MTALGADQIFVYQLDVHSNVTKVLSSDTRAFFPAGVLRRRLLHRNGNFVPPRWPWDGRDGSTGTQNTSTQCAWVVRIHIMCLGPLRDLYGTPRAPKRARFGPFGGPGGPWAAPGGLIWAQVPLVGPTGWAASISCAWAPYETTMSLLGPPKGPVLAQKVFLGAPEVLGQPRGA